MLNPRFDGYRFRVSTQHVLRISMPIVLFQHVYNQSTTPWLRLVPPAHLLKLFMMFLLFRLWIFRARLFCFCRQELDQLGLPLVEHCTRPSRQLRTSPQSGRPGDHSLRSSRSSRRGRPCRNLQYRWPTRRMQTCLATIHRRTLR